MNYKKLLLIGIIILFVIIAIYSMQGVITPYVSFKEAMATEDFVQVIGKLNKTIPINYTEEYFTFSLIDDKGDGMPVLYRKTKPLNFEHADQIVVLGSYKREKNFFEADKLLIKCPSKYEKEKK